MTDLEKFVELYKSVGIELHPKRYEDYFIICIGECSHKTNEPFFEVDDYSKLNGYSWFYTRIEFTLDGEFVSQGFWE